MITARTGAAVAAITFSIMTCAPALAQMTTQQKFEQLEQAGIFAGVGNSAGTGMDVGTGMDDAAALQKDGQEMLDQLKKKQEELLQQERQWLQQLMQEQQAALAKLKQQQQEEAERKQQQALLEKLKQQQEAEQKQKQKTTAEKFKELKEAGIFQKAGNAGPNKSGPDDQQVSREQLAAVIGDALGSFSADAYASYLQAVQGDPLVPSTPIDPQQLILAMLQGLNGAPGDKPDNPPGDDWAQQYIQAALEKGLLEDTQFGEKQLRDNLIAEAKEAGGSDDVTGGGTGGAWSDYPFYADGSITSGPLGADFLDSSGYGDADYAGIVRGEDAKGGELLGDASFHVTFLGGSAELDGAFDFDNDDHVGLGGTATTAGLDIFVVPDQALLGGSVDDSDFDANFYGPNAEELGGDWNFTVNGGTAPGTASGQFAAKR